MVEIIEIVVSIIILGIIARYILFTKELITSFLPPQLLPFMLLAIAISIVQYIVSRKDD